MGRGGGKGGRGGRGGPMTRDVQVSKKLSWLLRHGAEQEGLKLGEGGYLSLQDVVSRWCPYQDQSAMLIPTASKSEYSLTESLIR